ncbi:MAG: hypothetical protein QNJ19_15315 [Woeseiaceae bacterium]|nr:hypothetical protein [Woeseiaceae bacterium]
MQSTPSVSKRPLLVLVALLGCQLDAVAATGVSACDNDIQTAAASELKLVDYSDKRTTSASSELLKEPPAIESSALPLTSRRDTTVLRDDHVKSDLQLPVEKPMDVDPDAAAILLERRHSRLRKTSDDEASEMNTRLPGMDENEMLQFRQQMYRTDI